MNNKPIGVFDSGVGGLTVLESLMEKLPNEDFIYVADQGHCPYGTKKEKEIINCISNVGKFLLKNDVKAIVIACNTASNYKKEIEKMTNIPVISVIEPTCKKAIEMTKNNNVAVLGTIATIKKGLYQKMLSDNGINPYPVACSEFVDFIENKDLSDPVGQEIVNKKLTDLVNKNIDTLIHGCTHFSIIEDKIRNVLGNINYIACGKATSEELFKVLTENKCLRTENNKRFIKIYTTGNIQNAQKTMKWFKLPLESIKHIDISD